MALQKSSMKVNNKNVGAFYSFDNQFEIDVNGNEGMNYNEEAFEKEDLSSWSYWKVPLPDFDDGYSDFIDHEVLEEHTFGMDTLHLFPTSPFDVLYEDDTGGGGGGGGGGITSGCDDILMAVQRDIGVDGEVNSVTGDDDDDDDDEEGGFVVLGWWDKCWLLFGLWKLV